MKKDKIKAVIMAGGMGTRIASIANDIPKPMIKIGDKPVLEHLIICLKNQGYTDIIITVGYLKHIIMDYFKDGSSFDVNIEYYEEETPLGNAGALFKIKDKLTDDFLLINSDSIFEIDFNRFVDYHYSKGGLVTLFAHPNSHPYDSGLLITNKDNAVIKWLTKEEDRPIYYKNLVNAGLHIINKKVLDVEINTPKIDLDRQILKPLANTGKMFVYKSPEYIKDMGTPERYNDVCNDFDKGTLHSKNLLNKQKAIFIDRDGTINKYKGFIRNIEDFELIDGVSEAIRKINKSDYLAIVITNQPVIARGEVTLDELDEIHNKMETLLGNDGAYLDAIYYCPHHPDKGYEGERIKYKISCDCRKPKPGLILRAAKDFNIDLEKSYMIGDSIDDILCGKNANCMTAYIGTGDSNADICANSLQEAVNKIL